jgi:two-component system, chemotaxis family, chemotaxis protein CheY
MKFCLLVEQSDVIRKIAKHLLEEEHYLVVEADNGKTALDLFKRGAPDLILLDWQVQNIGALEFLVQIQPLLDESKSTRIIYCTTENDPIVISKALNAGATDILMKPFNRQMFVSKLQPQLIAA